MQDFQKHFALLVKIKFTRNVHDKININFLNIKRGKTIFANFVLIALAQNTIKMSIIDKMLFFTLDVTSGRTKSVQL